MFTYGNFGFWKQRCLLNYSSEFFCIAISSETKQNAAFLILAWPSLHSVTHCCRATRHYSGSTRRFDTFINYVT